MRRFITPRLALLAVGHFSIDAYSSFFSPLLPLLVARLHLSLTSVGVLVALVSLSSSLSQPLFGMLSDRLARPWFVAFGPLVAAVFMSAIGLAPHFGSLVALLMIGGLGAAAFHPQAAVLASDTLPRRSVAMSLFVTGGTVGFSLGPLYAVTVVGLVGIERTWLAAAPGLLVAGLMLAWFSRAQPRRHHAAARPRLAELRPMLRPLTLLYFAVVCRSAVSYGFMTFLALYLHARGVPVAAGGALLTAYLLSGALGGFFGGWLAERWGGKRVVVASFIGAIPLFNAFLLLQPFAGIVALVLGSFALQASLPVNVVMGQELSPRHSSTISSLLMGAAWGLGALLVGPIGALAHAHGLPFALFVLALLLVGGLGCALALPDVRRHVPVAEMAQPATVVD
ncbi:MAG: hypothetical protein A2V63_01560 [Candidatus Eisenbacteria bacterium RBG_19FT_COMBO_70_11]|nr:MAG: hypothetical protein A2V63_01560 [Candidatus Eisenbacteria bacterium RBG_19FT_COMBO_70_11]